ncbi:MAG: hypothetical protein PVI00_07960 [Desulfobacterales bacterium]|jgi:hypothetical protein
MRIFFRLPGWIFRALIGTLSISHAANITADPQNNQIWGFEWPVGDTVTLTIEDPDTPVSPDHTNFQIASTEDIWAFNNVHFNMDLVSFGLGPHQNVIKNLLMNLAVWIYRVADIEAAGISPVNHKVHEDITKNLLIPVYPTAEQTSMLEEYRCTGVPKDNYVVIGHADGWKNGEIFVSLKMQTGKKEKTKEKKDKKAKKKDKKIVRSVL